MFLKKYPSLLALILVLLCLCGCGERRPDALAAFDGVWYFASTGVECRVGDGKIYRDDHRSRKGESLLGVYSEAEDHIEGYLALVGSVSTLRSLYVAQTDEGQVIQGEDGTIYFYRDPLAALARLEALEAPSEAPLRTLPVSDDETAESLADPSASSLPESDPANAGLDDATAPAEAVRSSGDRVWVSKTGSKYHSTPTCSGMKGPVELSLAQAQSEGYSPCKRCH